MYMILSIFITCSYKRQYIYVANV